MKVQVTKAMATFLNKNIQQYTFSVAKVHTWYYSDPIDYDNKSGMTKVIRVSYPAEYYAMPKELSTTDLAKIFMRSDRTADGFIQAVMREIEI